MSLLFVHDTPFRKIGETYYSVGGLDDDVLKRYTDIFGKTSIYCRIRNENVVQQSYKKIANTNLTFFSKFTLSRKDLAELVKKSDKIIIRMPSFTGIEILPICKKYKKDYLIEMVACPWDQFVNHSFIGKLIALPVFFINKFACLNAPYVLYVTNSFLQNRYPTRGKSIACSDVNLVRGEINWLTKRKELINFRDYEDKIVLGTLAAVDVKFKNQKKIIEVISKLNKMGNKNFYYSLAGGGKQDYLKKIAKKNKVTDFIFFEGELKHDEIDEWFQNIDIYIQPSKQEGLPRAVLEAMNFALPCIGSNAGGIPELITKEYIYKNNIFSTKNICKLLLRMMKKDVLQFQSKIQYEKAEEFLEKYLSKKRNAFMIDFRDNK